MLSPFLQHTLAAPVRIRGLGIHAGRPANLTLRPADAGSGVVFERIDVTDRDRRIVAAVDQVRQTDLGTVIGNAAGVTVSTVEHLMAVLCALAIDNVVVEIDGPEVPIMDGSAIDFVTAIDRAGRRVQRAPRRYLEILAPVVVSDGEKAVTIAPCDRFELAFEIRFDSPAIGRQSVDLVIDEASFRRELADCRTFGFLAEFEALTAAGFAKGGSLANAVVVDDVGVVNPEGLRRSDEFVRHKVLDAVGDLYLLGAPLLGRYEGRYAGHGLNNAVSRALLARPEAWRLASWREDLAEAI